MREVEVLAMRQVKAPWTAGRRGAAVALALAAGATAAGCSVVHAVSTAAGDVTANRTAISGFTRSLGNGTAGPFSVSYVTTAGSPATIGYAVRPPRDLAFTETSASPSGSGTVSLRLVSNASGEYSCSSLPAGQGHGWACQKLAKSTAAAQNQIVGLYTPAHWAGFLTSLSVAAGFAGDRVTTSATTVHGIALHCIDFRTRKAAAPSMICATAQGVLGLVKVAGNPIGFEISGYTATPPAALFRLPAGATVTGRTG